MSYDATEVSPRNEIDTEETSPFLNPVLLSLFDEPGRCGGLSRPPGRAPVPLGFRHGTVLWAWALACDGSHHPHPPWGSLAPALLQHSRLPSSMFSAMGFLCSARYFHCATSLCGCRPLTVVTFACAQNMCTTNEDHIQEYAPTTTCI